VEAPQSVDDAFWTGPAEPRRLAGFQALFAGRPHPEKGLDVLRAAWRTAALPDAALAVATDESAAELRNFYAGSDVVVVPSLATRAFLEPWGLVVNESFDRGVPVIATTAVGAVAGGLVQHERTGLVVAPGDADALAGALRRLHGDPALRARLGTNARDAVRAFSHESWAAGMARALAAVGAGTPPGGC
jgi:glycosyltransferase involved in cell wall biosynthesis